MPRSRSMVTASAPSLGHHVADVDLDGFLRDPEWVVLAERWRFGWIRACRSHHHRLHGPATDRTGQFVAAFQQIPPPKPPQETRSCTTLTDATHPAYHRW